MTLLRALCAFALAWPLLGAFAGMQRIEVQAATPLGQFKRTLLRPAKRPDLGR